MINECSQITKEIKADTTSITDSKLKDSMTAAQTFISELQTNAKSGHLYKKVKTIANSDNLNHSKKKTLGSSAK